MGKVISAIVKWFVTHPEAVAVIKDVVTEAVDKKMGK